MDFCFCRARYFAERLIRVLINEYVLVLARTIFRGSILNTQLFLFWRRGGEGGYVIEFLRLQVSSN